MTGVKRVLSLFICLVGVLAFGATRAWSQCAAANEAAAGGDIGRNGEIQLLRVQINGCAGGRQLQRMDVTLEDRGAGADAADIDFLYAYEDDDGVFSNGGWTLIGSKNVVADPTSAYAIIINWVVTNGKYYIVTAKINAAATVGNSFRLTTAVNYIRVTGGGPPSTFGSALTGADVNIVARYSILSVEGIRGIKLVGPRDERTIYTLTLDKPLASVDNLQYIQVTLEDLIPSEGPTGVAGSDIGELRLYRDGTLVATESAVNIGLPTTIYSDGVDPAAPATITFTITAVMSENPTVGHAFRLSAPLNNIEVNYTLDGSVSSGNNNSVWVTDPHRTGPRGPLAIDPATGGDAASPMTIPIGGLWAVAIGILGYGIYRIKKRGLNGPR